MSAANQTLLVLRTGLFPATGTITDALQTLQGKPHIESFDLSTEVDWDVVLELILTARRVMTV